MSLVLLKVVEKKEFEWIPLDEKWQRKLLSKSFMEKDCIGDGNCQFRSIETALTDAGYKTTHSNLRRLIARYINKISDKEFHVILQNYRIEKENGEFSGGWDPDQVRNKKDFIKTIKQTGFYFEGDNITLALLSKAINVDFIVLDDDYNITDLSNPDALSPKIIMLYYLRSGHYKTIGIKNKYGNVKTIFKREQLPKELDTILDKYNYLLEHVKRAYENLKLKKVTLNGIMREIQMNLGVGLTKDDKKVIITILRNIMQMEEYIKNQ
jgi:hypothetical protein